MAWNNFAKKPVLKNEPISFCSYCGARMLSPHSCHLCGRESSEIVDISQIPLTYFTPEQAAKIEKIKLRLFDKKEKKEKQYLLDAISRNEVGFAEVQVVCYTENLKYGSNCGESRYCYKLLTVDGKPIEQELHNSTNRLGKPYCPKKGETLTLLAYRRKHSWKYILMLPEFAGNMEYIYNEICGGRYCIVYKHNTWLYM